MNAVGFILVGSLMAVVGLQVVHRVLGALAAVAWCVGTTVWGFQIITESLPFRFFFLPRDPILFGITMMGFTGYCVWNLARALRGRHRKIAWSEVEGSDLIEK